MNVIILCGGKGTRLKPLTINTPKPMIKIKGKPILYYIINQLKKNNFNKFYITTGYLSNIIETYFENNFKELDINIVNDGDVDIIERIKSVIRLEPNDEIMVIYGDTISDVDINSLIKYHKSQKNEGTMTLWPLKTNFGIVDIDDKNNITDFIEKPTLDKWINIGYFCIKPSLYNELFKFSSFAKFLSFCGNNKKLSAFKHLNNHYTINNLIELEIAENNIDKIY